MIRINLIPDLILLDTIEFAKSCGGYSLHSAPGFADLGGPGLVLRRLPYLAAACMVENLIHKGKIRHLDGNNRE